MSSAYRVGHPAVRNEEYYEQRNVEAAQLLPDIANRVQAVVTVEGRALVKMAPIHRDVQAPLLRLLQVVYSSWNVTLEPQLDGSLHVKVVKQRPPGVLRDDPLEEKGNQQGVEQKRDPLLQEFDQLLGFLGEEFRQGKASVNVNIFRPFGKGAMKPLERNQLLAIAKEAYPEWEMTIEQSCFPGPDTFFLTAKEHQRML